MLKAVFCAPMALRRPIVLQALCVCLLAAPVAALEPGRAVTQYRADSWTRRQGLPQASVLAIEQDHDGYLWLGTQEGVARFDGVTFEKHAVEDTPEIRHNFVNALHTDTAGRVWLGTDGGSVTVFAQGRFTTFDPGRSSRGPVRGIAGDARGQVLVAFRDAGLFRAAGERLEPVPAGGPKPHPPVGILARGRDRRLWLGVAGGVVRGDGSAWTFLPVAWARGRVVTALAEDRSGALWIACAGPEVVRLDVRGATAEPLSAPVRLPTPVRHLAVDSAGTLWIGGGDGLFRVREGSSSPPEQMVTPRPTGAVDVVREDPDGDLWIGTRSEGLLRLRSEEVIPFGTPEGLPHDVVWNVLETSDGWLYASTNGGLARRREGSFEPVLSPLFPTSDIVALGEGHDGSLWAGTYSHGVFHRPAAGGAWEGLGPESGVPPGPVTVVFEDRRGRLWVGSREGLAAGRGHHLERVALTTGPARAYVTSIVEDAGGTVWVATYGTGLFAFTGGALRHGGPVPGLPSEQLNALLLDTSNRLWIATNDHGLAVLDHGRTGHVDTRHGLPFALVLWLVEDRRGGLWMSTNHGIVEAPLAALARAAFGAQDHVTARIFDEGDGMRGAELSATGQPAGWRTRDGRIWFPGTGLSAIDPAALREPVPPKAVVRGVSADGVALPLPEAGRTLALAPGHGELAVELTALSFDEPAGTQFRYRLLGFDTDWREAGTSRSVRYTNLPPRAYRFEAAARHQDGGAYGPAAVLDLRLAPRFDQTWAFRLLLAASVAALVVSGVHLRNRRLRALVARRTVELSQANAALAATAAREQQAREKAETALAEAGRAAQAKSVFLSTVSHELRTPLHAILSMNDLLLESLAQPHQREWSGLVQESGNTLLGLVDALLDFARIEHGDIAVKREPFDLPHCLRSCVAASAPAAKAKGLALTFTFAPPGGCRVLGDERLVYQVARHLIANAVKFTEQGGVAVDAELTEQEDGCALRLTVRDTGVGIAPEHQETIFQPFVQADSGFTRRFGGAGLGLAIAARLCAAMGGTIAVESTPGAGSTFRVNVPLQRVPPTAEG